MRQAQWIQQGITLGNQFHYRKKNPWLHNAFNLSMLGALVAGFIGTLYASTLVHPLIYIPVAAFILGVISFGLVILVVHEASHGMFIITQDRNRALPWNRFFGWMVSIVYSINYTRHWEEGHQIHHLHPVEPGDPQTANLWTGKDFLREFTRMLVIPGYVFKWNPSRQYKTQRWLAPVNGLFWATAFTLMVIYWSWAAPVAVLFGLGVTGALNQAKGSMEHGGPIATEPNRNLRSRTSLFPMRWLLMPFNISIHFEHHLNYCVPWYDLMRYHRALREIVPEPVRPQIFNHRVWDQLMGRMGMLTDDIRPLLVSGPGSTAALDDDELEAVEVDSSLMEAGA